MVILQLWTVMTPIRPSTPVRQSSLAMELMKIVMGLTARVKGDFATTVVSMPKTMSVMMAAQGHPMASVILVQIVQIVGFETPVKTPAPHGIQAPMPTTVCAKMVAQTRLTPHAMSGQTVRIAGLINQPEAMQSLALVLGGSYAYCIPATKHH